VAVTGERAEFAQADGGLAAFDVLDDLFTKGLARGAAQLNPFARLADVEKFLSGLFETARTFLNVLMEMERNAFDLARDDVVVPQFQDLLLDLALGVFARANQV
jgi:hypothetical protein